MAATGEQRRAIDDRIAVIANRNKGRLTAAMIVRDARDAKSPLHACIPWDTERNSVKWQLVCARRLIARVTVVVRTERIELRVPCYVRDPSRGPSEAGHIATAVLRDEVELARAALEQECQRLESLIRRLQLLAATLNLESEISLILAGAEKLRAAAPPISLTAH